LAQYYLYPRRSPLAEKCLDNEAAFKAPAVPVLKIPERVGKTVETLIAIAPHLRANADGLLALRRVLEE
jgi:hypothetical protein